MSAADHPASQPDDRLLQSCEEQRSRRSGPGGQHRNKVETAVRLRHGPTGVEAEASERRSQAENRRVALFRLRIQLALQVRSDRQDVASPSELWRSRCWGGRIAVNPEHNDFPALLAEALDHLAANDFEIKPTSEFLNITPSQLVKFLKREPPAFGQLNRERTARGKMPLL